MSESCIRLCVCVCVCGEDMKRVHLSVQVYHQSAADCIMKIVAEHIPEVRCLLPSYFTAQCGMHDCVCVS